MHELHLAARQKDNVQAIKGEDPMRAINFLIHKSVAFSLIFFFAIIIARRPSQFLSPYVWDEDGTQIIPNLINSGFWGIFEPVNGYMALSASLINYVSLRLSFIFQPYFSYWITLGVTFLLIFQIARKLDFKWGIFPIIAVFLLVPTDPEVYAVGLYSFWLFGTYALLMMLLILKGSVAPDRLDVLLITVALLSSPFAWVMFPVFLALLLSLDLNNLRRPYVLAALLGFVVQGYFILTESAGRPLKDFLHEILQSVWLPIPTFFGNFIGHGLSIEVQYVAGALLLALVLYLQFLVLKKNWRMGVFLFAAGCVAIFLSWYRIPNLGIHPRLAGPRYFYYPYTVTLIYLILVPLLLNRRALAVVGTAVIALALVLNFSILARKHYMWSWSYYAHKCVRTQGNTELLVFFDGKLQSPWSVSISQEDCQKLIQQSLLDSAVMIP